MSKDFLEFLAGMIPNEEVRKTQQRADILSNGVATIINELLRQGHHQIEIARTLGATAAVHAAKLCQEGVDREGGDHVHGCAASELLGIVAGFGTGAFRGLEAAIAHNRQIESVDPDGTAHMRPTPLDPVLAANVDMDIATLRMQVSDKYPLPTHFQRFEHMGHGASERAPDWARIVVPAGNNKLGIECCPVCVKFGLRWASIYGDHHTFFPFRDHLSAYEYYISGLCQECQDATFKDPSQPGPGLDEDGNPGEPEPTAS